MKKIIFIGGGIGALASATLLARKGFEVTIIEKNEKVGGRLNKINENGFLMDKGPTLLLMPWVLKEFFKNAGEKIEDYFELKQIDPVYDVYFGSKKKISISSDNAKTLEAIRKISEKDADNYFKYLAKGQEYYKLAKENFLTKNVHKITDFLNPQSLLGLMTIGLSNTYYQHVCKHFENENVRAAFSFQSIYVGASPEDIPAAYSLIQFVEVSEGVWSIEGGLNKVAEALEKIALKNKVKIMKNTEVEKIQGEGDRAKGVRLKDGSFVSADIVVSDVDLPHTYKDLIKENSSPVQNRELIHSCSAFMIYAGIKRKLPLKHNIFLLPKNFISALNDLFHNKKMPEDPGIYLNVPSKTFPSMAPKGKESLYILVPVPNKEADINWKKEKGKFRKKVLEKINSILEIDLKEEDFEFEKIITPDDWENDLSLEYGSTFGLAPTLMQSAFFRPQNKDPKIKNLYFVGASTHPGSGIPIVLFSANNLVQRIIEEN